MTTCRSDTGPPPRRHRGVSDPPLLLPIAAATMWEIRPSTLRNNPGNRPRIYMGPCRIVHIALLDLFGPLFKWYEIPDAGITHLPVGCGISITLEVDIIDCLEVQCHLHCLTHPDVVKGRHTHVKTGRSCRRTEDRPQIDFGVGPLEALCLVDRPYSIDVTEPINPTRITLRAQGRGEGVPVAVSMA